MNLGEIIKESKQELKAVLSLEQLEIWRIKYFGRKNEFQPFLEQLKKMAVLTRKKQGALYNQSRKELENLYQEKSKVLHNSAKGDNFVFDYSIPGHSVISGHLHPLTLTIRKVVKVFEKMGFEIIEGPEVEGEYYNFDALNILADHPARDMWDTLWLKTGSVSNKKELGNKLLLRTHTSPNQIRFMQKDNPPFRVIAPGRCFRHEATDATHEMQFYQIEGLVVSEDINLANFKFIMEEAMKEIFKKDVTIRFVPDYFPFVSPGIEVDVSCFKCHGKGCKLCSNTGWLEVMGAGMVHPKVLENVGYVQNKYQGFAFGLGIERLAMLLYGIDDIRLFNSSDLRFLKQF